MGSSEMSSLLLPTQTTGLSAGSSSVEPTEVLCQYWPTLVNFARPYCVVRACMITVHTIRSGMAKTPTVERETATFRLPVTLLERARREGAARGLAYVRSVEEALEVYFLSRLPPPMAEALEQDIKELKLSREN